MLRIVAACISFCTFSRNRSSSNIMRVIDMKTMLGCYTALR